MISFTLMFLGIPHIQSSTYFSTIMSIEYNKSKYKLHGAQLLMNLCHKKNQFYIIYFFLVYILYTIIRQIMKLIFIEEHCQSITKTTTIQYGTNSTVVVWPASCLYVRMRHSRTLEQNVHVRTPLLMDGNLDSPQQFLEIRVLRSSQGCYRTKRWLKGSSVKYISS